MRVALLAGGLGAALMGCETEPEIPAAEFGEVCGKNGPVRVLELASDEFVDGYSSLRVNDRSLYFVGRFEPSTGKLVPGSRALWSVGSCGESPIQLTFGIDWVFAPAVWSGMVVGCDPSSGDVLAFDVTGATDRRVVMPATSPTCALRWTEFGALRLVTHEDMLATLMLQRFQAEPDDPAPAPVVLLEGIRLDPGVLYTELTPFTTSLHGTLYIGADHVLAMRADGAVVRVDLADGTVSTLETGVSAFQAARDGETVIWQDATVLAADEPEYPVGEVFLRSPEGQNAALGETSLAFGGRPLDLVEYGLVELKFGRQGPRRVFLLPSFDAVEVPRDLRLHAPLPDGRWVATIDGEYVIDIIDLRANVRTRAFPGPAELIRVNAASIDVLEVPLQAACCEFPLPYWTEGPMWRVSADGSQATRLAARATMYVQELGDGRLVSQVAWGEDQRGALVIAAPDSHEEGLIDDRVHMFSVDWSRLAAEGILGYSVADGARSGVYVANVSAKGGAP